MLSLGYKANFIGLGLSLDLVGRGSELLEYSGHYCTACSNEFPERDAGDSLACRGGDLCLTSGGGDEAGSLRGQGTAPVGGLGNKVLQKL